MSPTCCCPGCGRSGRPVIMPADGVWWRCCRSGYQPTSNTRNVYEVREKLLLASSRTLDRLLEPLRGQGAGRSLTRPGTLLRQQIPIRGNLWEGDKPGWLEVDTVALCGGSVAGEFVWMVDGVDYATTWVEVRAMWGRGQASTLAALQDIEASLPFRC